MNWTTLGVLIHKFFQIISLISKTAKEQGVTVEQVFALLDKDRGHEALSTATRIFIQEVNRLRKWNIEVWESPIPMTWDEAQDLAKTTKGGWRLPTAEDRLCLIEKHLGNHSFYWTTNQYTNFGTGCSFSPFSAGIHEEDKTKKLGACLIREAPDMIWQLVPEKNITPSEPIL